MIALTSPCKTPYHRVPAGLKLLALCVATALLYVLPEPWWQAGALICAVLLYLWPGRVFARAGLAALRPFALFAAIILAWHLATGTLAEGFSILVRLCAVIALANLVTMTTRLDDMIAVLQWLATPLRKLGLATQALEIAVALVVRFTPVLIIKARAVSEAWRARSVRRAGWRIVMPLALAALDDADHVAEALRARGGIS